MSPLDWAFLPLQRYFSFHGRSPRAEYWWFVLFQMMVGVIATLIDLALGLGGPEAPISTNLLFGLALFFPALGVTVRRLHDINRSGWTVLVYTILTFAAFVIGALLGLFMGTFGIVLMALGLLVLYGNFVILMASDGNPGENSYGHNPYGRTYGN